MEELNREILTNTESLTDRLKSCWLQVSAGVYGGLELIGKAKEFMELKAKAQQAEASFRSLADSVGANAESMIADMKRVTANTVDDSDMMQKAVKAMALDFKPEQIISIAEISRLAACSPHTQG